MFRGLTEVNDPRWASIASATMHALAASETAVTMVRELDRYEPERLDEIASFLRFLALARAEPLLALLDQAQNRKLRRMLVDALGEAKGAILPLIRQRLRSQEWYVVRNMITLLRRAGGTAADLATVAHHPMVQVRLEVARALRGMVHDTRAADVGASLLSDPADEVIAASLSALADLPLTPGAARALEATVQEERRSDEARKSALEALARSPLEEAAAALFRLVEPRGMLERPFLGALRERAAIGLARSPAPQARALFVEGLQSQNRRVRKAFERAREGGGG
jgi:hypothetical protein